MNAVIKNILTPKAVTLDWLARMTGSPNRWTRSMFVRVFTDGYGGDFEKNCKRAYQEHYDMVRALVPPERLLEYRGEQGWQPLCRFLGREQPQGEFPNGNTKEELETRIGAVVASKISRLRKLILFCVVLIMAFSVFCLRSCYFLISCRIVSNELSRTDFCRSGIKSARNSLRRSPDSRRLTTCSPFHHILLTLY